MKRQIHTRHHEFNLGKLTAPCSLVMLTASIPNMAIYRRTNWHGTRRMKLLFAMALLVLGIGAPASAEADVALAPPLGQCSEEGNYEVCVTNGYYEDPLIAQKITAKINATASSPQSGDYIRVAMFDWKTDGWGEKVAEALVNAANNDVSVRVVMASDNVIIKEQLKAANIDVKVCPDSCMPPNAGSMHNKFFLVQHGDTKLVMQSSSNLGATQEQHSQNLLISRDDAALFSHYVNYWRRLYVGSWTWDGVTWSEEERSRYGSNDLSRVYFYPQPTKDPVAGVLDGVSDCNADAGNARVWVAASLFDSERPEVLSQLKRLRGIGCDVRIVVQKDTARDKLLPGFPDKVKCNQWNHSKLIVIDAKYQGEWRKPVFVGSYNLTENSLERANDAMLRIINGWVTNRYIDYFNTIFTDAYGCDY